MPDSAAMSSAAQCQNDGFPQTSQFAAGPGIAETGPVRPGVKSLLPAVATVLTGTNDPAHLVQNLAAALAPALTLDEIKRLRALLD